MRALAAETSLSATTINITAPTVPGAAGAGTPGKAAAGLAGFEALMNAFFASTEGVLQAAGAAPSAAGAAVTTATTALPGAPASGLPIDPAQAGAGVGVGAGVTSAPVPSKTPTPDAGQLVGKTPAAAVADASTAQAAQSTPALVAQAPANTDPSAIVKDPRASSDKDPAKSDADARSDVVNPADMTAVLSLLAPVPLARPVTPAPAASAEPSGSSKPAPGAEGPLLPAMPAQAATDAAGQPLVATTGENAPLETLAKGAAQNLAPAPAPARSDAQPVPAPTATAAEPAKIAAPPAPAPAQQPPAQEPVTLAAQAAPPPPAPASVGEKPAKPTRAVRENTDAAPAGPAAVRPGPTTTASAAAQPETTKDPGADLGAEPRLADAKPQSADPQAALAEPAPAQAAATTAHAPPPAAVRGSPETVANLAAQMVKKLGARTSQFDVQLDPVGLGRVNVRVAIDADGRMSAAMSCDNPQATAELKSRANELHRALAQSGFDLTGGLSFDASQDQGGGAYQGQQNAFQGGGDNPGQTFRGRAFTAALETAQDAVQTALTAKYPDGRATPAGVDVRI